MAEFRANGLSPRLFRRSLRLKTSSASPAKEFGTSTKHLDAANLRRAAFTVASRPKNKHILWNADKVTPAPSPDVEGSHGPTGHQSETMLDTSCKGQGRGLEMSPELPRTTYLARSRSLRFGPTESKLAGHAS